MRDDDFCSTLIGLHKLARAAGDGRRDGLVDGFMQIFRIEVERTRTPPSEVDKSGNVIMFPQRRTSAPGRPVDGRVEKGSG